MQASRHNPHGADDHSTIGGAEHRPSGFRQDFGITLDALERYLRTLSWPVVVSSLVIVLTGLVLPFAINRVYDRVVPQDSTGTLLMLTSILIGCVVIEIVMRVCRSYLLGRGAVVNGWFEMRAHLEWLAGSRSGDVGRAGRQSWLKSMNLASTATDTAASPARLFAVELLLVPVFFVLLALIAGASALLPLLVCIAGFILVVRTGRHYRRLLEERIAVEAELKSFQEERIGAAAQVRSLGARLASEQEHARLVDRSVSLQRDLMVMGDHAQGLGQNISQVAQFAMIGAGALLAIDGQITVGIVVCCSILAIRLAQPFSRLAIAWQEVQLDIASRRAVAAVAAVRPAEATLVEPAAVGGASALQVEGAAVAYEGGTVLAASDIDLMVAAGEWVTIVGNDASAKLALLRLFAGESSPAAGRVLVDQRPATEISKGAIGSISFVRELPALVRGTILTNITLHRAWVSTDRARAAARLAGLEADVLRLPQGFSTKIEDGAAGEITAGMRKRIGFARSFASTPRLLVISEPQVGLDLAGQAQIEATLRSLRGRCTIVLSTNSPRLVRAADRAFELRGGRLEALSFAAPGAAGSVP